LKNGRLRLLMFEKMYTAVNGVWNLSSEQVISVIINIIIYFFKMYIYDYDYIMDST